MQRLTQSNQTKTRRTNEAKNIAMPRGFGPEVRNFEKEQRNIHITGVAVDDNDAAADVKTDRNPKGHVWAVWWMLHQIPLQLVEHPACHCCHCHLAVYCTVGSLSAFQVLFADNSATIPSDTEKHLLVRSRLATKPADSPGADQ
ncbi:hypothetical protein AVEN_9442-1 [Araneus ventricosus]|uniref:Uncharacterized protein n=1 Tax=Araneus ventricosus TaxID=182803 RepID=A0A4Y2FQL7_ARAVE|nr:hypothetical protein AVEN_9442-1 [Araneus ventricosus]